MNNSAVDTLYVICQLEKRVPMRILAERIGYVHSAIAYHLRQLESLGLITKRSRGFWIPTFEGPYDHERLRERVFIRAAKRMTEEIPWLSEKIGAIENDVLRTESRELQEVRDQGTLL